MAESERSSSRSSTTSEWTLYPTTITIVHAWNVRLFCSALSRGLANQRSNLASFNARSLAARFDKTESMLLQITDAVQANRQLSDADTKVGGGTVGG